MKIAKLHSVAIGIPVWDAKTKTLGLGVSKHGEKVSVDKYYGKVSLSLKVGKKRVIVKGKIDCTWEDHREGLYHHWFFKPLNPQHEAKLLKSDIMKG